MAKQYEIIFSGLVQGVGFRFSARNLAAKHNIKGWVMNLSDGKVKLLAEGRGEDLDNFLHSLKERFRESIDDYTLQEKETGKTYDSFEIKFSSQ